MSETQTAGSPVRNLRGFLDDLAAAHPDDVLRVSEPVALDYEMTAIAMELESRGQSPVLWFERVGDSPFPVVANVQAELAAVVPDLHLDPACLRMAKRVPQQFPRDPVDLVLDQRCHIPPRTFHCHPEHGRIPRRLVGARQFLAGRCD